MKRFRADWDWDPLDIPPESLYHEVIAKIVPASRWDQSAIDYLRKYFSKTISNIQAKFPDSEIEAFAYAYETWNCSRGEHINDDQRHFLERASRLNKIQSIALMLLIMGKLYPEPPKSVEIDNDVPF